MHSRRLSLASIMNSWVGDDVHLKVQGFKIILLENKQAKNKRLDHLVSNGVGLFSRLSRGDVNSNYQTQKENMNGPNSYKSQQQFVVKAKSKSPKNPMDRVSLADLGQLYTNSRNIILNKSERKKRASETYNEPQPKYSSNRYTFDSQTKSNYSNNYSGSSSKNYQNSKYERMPLGDHNSIQSKKQYPQYATAPKANTHLNNENQYGRNYDTGHKQQKYKIKNEDMEEIMESIIGIKLPLDQSLCPEYEKASRGFQNMKADILQKIVKSGQANELQTILSEIRRAADQIIARHYPAPPKLQKHGIFSFKDNIEEHNPTLVQPKLKKIQEEDDDKSHYITLPQFQDEGASISSISSNNGIKNNDSKDEDFCKIENVFINDGQNNLIENHEQNNDSIKLIVLETKKSETDPQPIKLDFMRQPKNQEYPEESFKVKDTIRMSKALPDLKRDKPLFIKTECKTDNGVQNSLKAKIQNRVQISQKILPAMINNVQNKETAFLKKQEPYNGLINQNNDGYQLQKITTGPVKIISNLQQAQKFDPEVVKFTELKLNFLETRTITPEIITIPSPLRFRRKEEVVKHLVAAQIVERQSNSIQY